MKPRHIKNLRRVLDTGSTNDALAHVRIYKAKNGYRVQAGRRKFALDIPSEFEVDASVDGTKFLNALESCDTPAVTFTGKNAIVKDGKFRAQVPCADVRAYPIVQPDGNLYDVPENFVENLSTLLPFAGNDSDARIWMHGILLKDGSMFATNGFAMARIDAGIPDVNITIPVDSVAELIKVAQPVTGIRISDHSITFRLGADSWFRSALISAETPDLSRIVDGTPAETPVPEGLCEIVGKVGKFGEGKYAHIVFRDGAVECGGAKITGVDVPDCEFMYALLRTVLDVATHIDFTGYPAPCRFSGGTVTGAVMGVRT